MLEYNIRLNSDSRKDFLDLDDFYVHPSLSIISGTTEKVQNLSMNDEFWVSSEYLPFDKRVNVEFLETVVRNGYILYEQEVEIQVLYYHSEAQEKDIAAYYVEIDDVVYYKKNNKFNINGDFIEVENNQSTITILKKAYVENGKVNIDGKVYNVIINDNGVIVSDSMGYGCSYNLVTSHVDRTPVEVYKIGFRNEPETIIDIKKTTRFGYIPFIDYDGERIELQKLYDDEGDFTGYGVKIGTEQYLMETDSSEALEMGLSNPDVFQMMEFDGEGGINIDGIDYKIQFEPRDYEEGDFLCFETSSSNPTIMIGDVVKLKSTDYATIVDVLGEGEHKYTFINAIRYNSIRNLCDTVTIGDKEYRLDYVGDSSKPYVGMLATVDYGNETEIFKVLSVKDNRATALVKVKKQGDEWQEAYTITRNLSGGTEYIKATNYNIKHYDGFLVDGIAYPIEASEIYDSEGFVIDTKNVLYLNKPVEYELKVETVLGNNKIICVPNIDREIVQEEDYYIQKNLVFSTLVNNSNFVMYRRGSMFGMKDLTAKKWLKEAVEAPKPTSTYILSQSHQKIRLYRENEAFAITFGMSSNINNDGLREGLLLNYSTEKGEDAINKIVDMEKDVYSPIIREEEEEISVENIMFNLHFRTRDLETWRMIKDKGRNGTVKDDTTDNSEELDVSNLYSNWFVTDYYPYNEIIKNGTNEQITKLMNLSDLLGLLYFTTNDVEVNRPKVSGSFLRLTYYDSRDPEKQNLLGTSVLYLNTKGYFDTLKRSKEGENVVYEEVTLTFNPNRTSKEGNSDMFFPDYGKNLGVFMECYTKDTTKVYYTTSDMEFDETKRLGSHISVSDRYDTSHSSEGFYTYLLKHIANKRKKQTIYLKIEFFHAGLGIKIPMCIPTDKNMNAISIWNKAQVENLKDGYDPNEVILRQYIPIDISYSLDRKEFVYEISSQRNFSNAIKQDNNLVFNLFEIKSD